MHNNITYIDTFVRVSVLLTPLICINSNNLATTQLKLVLARSVIKGRDNENEAKENQFEATKLLLMLLLLIIVVSFTSSWGTVKGKYGCL